MSLPFFESPLRWKAGTTGKLEVVATVPTTVFGVGEVTPSPPQPASRMAPSAAAAAMTAGWRTAEDSNEPLRRGDAGTGRDPLLSTIGRMKRKNFGRDRGLSVRMVLTSGLLGLLYVVFAVVLFSVFNFGLVAMLVIVIGIAVFQYFSSAKLALAASGAKVVSQEEAPDLHAMVERLCAMADLPKPDRSGRLRRAERIRDRPEPEARGRRRDDRALAAARAAGDRKRARP